MTIESICEQYNITNYTINPDGSIDVDGTVDLSNKNLTKLPLKFGRVTGHFYCYDNNLTDLDGSPTSVSGSFFCYNNQLTSYTYILNIDIQGRISIDGKSYITKKEILIMSLNDILKSYDLIIDSNYLVKDIYGNIVVKSSESKLKNDVMELVV